MTLNTPIKVGRSGSFNWSSGTYGYLAVGGYQSTRMRWGITTTQRFKTMTIRFRGGNTPDANGGENTGTTYFIGIFPGSYETYLSAGTLDAATAALVKVEASMSGDRTIYATLETSNLAPGSYYIWFWAPWDSKRIFANVDVDRDVIITGVRLRGVYLYDGSAWGEYEVYVYDGSNWQQYAPHYYDGSAWQEA